MRDLGLPTEIRWRVYVQLFSSVEALELGDLLSVFHLRVRSSVGKRKRTFDRAHDVCYEDVRTCIEACCRVFCIEASKTMVAEVAHCLLRMSVAESKDDRARGLTQGLDIKEE